MAKSLLITFPLIIFTISFQRARSSSFNHSPTERSNIAVFKLVTKPEMLVVVVYTCKVLLVLDCILPDHPAHGKWEILGTNSDAKPGDITRKETVLKYTCLSTFLLNTDVSYSICIDGEWNIQPACNDLWQLQNNYSESNKLLREKRQVDTSNDCTLPNYPLNGKWTIITDSSNKSPGNTTATYSVLSYQCNEGFLLSPPNTVPICVNGKWTSLPKCAGNCDLLQSTDTLTVSCFNGQNEISCENSNTGTVARVKCNQFYEIRTEEGIIERTELQCGDDGQWNGDLPLCEPVCGYRKYGVKNEEINSVNASQGEFPWQVAILLDQVQQCAGALVSPNISLTVAHCFDYAQNAGKGRYLIAVGKFYREYNDSRDSKAQFSKIKTIIRHKGYNNGLPYGAFDLAIIIHKTPFLINDYVLPVCFDRSETFTNDLLKYKKGLVTGWGYTTPWGNSAEALKLVEVNYKSKEDCILPKNFRRYYLPNAPDNLCAKVFKEVPGKILCNHDSGNPLVFLGDLDRYYVRALVSIGPIGIDNNTCSEEGFNLYTSMEYYRKLLLPYLPKQNLKLRLPTFSTVTSKPESAQLASGCIAPKYSQNGRWSVAGSSQYQPEQIVPPETILNFTCNTGYRLRPSNPLSSCYNGKWNEKPECIQVCSTLESNDRMTVECDIYKGNVSCKNPYEGTRAKVSCKFLFEDPSVNKNPYRYCNNGSWDYALPICEPVCGIKSVDPQKLVIGGKIVTKGEYPWQVGIYRASDEDHICGGSIVSEKLVLTAAHCFEDPEASLYLLATGKFYRTYNDSRDQYAQYSKIQEIIIHEDYNKGVPFIAFDIAIVVVQNAFRISSYVLPVCFDPNPAFDFTTLLNKKGIVTGWGFTTSRGNPSEVLKELEVDYKPRRSCTLPKSLKRNYLPYAPDKLCAGVLEQGQSACIGDSGGGLVFPDDRQERYFIHGIVSVAPIKSNGGCDENHLTLYTSVQYHAELIHRYISMYKSY